MLIELAHEECFRGLVVYRRALEEAYAVARAVELSCGSTPELGEALRLIEDLVSGSDGPEDVEYAAALLRQAADVLRLRGCLDWYLLSQAADVLEHA